MKRIIFNNATAQKIYDDYFKRVERCIQPLSADDQRDLLMDLNSHIYEATHTAPLQDEVEVLVDTIEKLGPPEETLMPVIAHKKTQQAIRSFNPGHIFQALYLNISNGIGYVILTGLYLLIAAMGILIILKWIYPSHTGLFSYNGHFQAFGFTTSLRAGSSELLGPWFIPTVCAIMIVLYVLNTLVFRLLKKS
jgi:hypothetical protein